MEQHVHDYREIADVDGVIVAVRCSPCDRWIAILNRCLVCQGTGEIRICPDCGDISPVYARWCSCCEGDIDVEDAHHDCWSCDSTGTEDGWNEDEMVAYAKAICVCVMQEPLDRALAVTVGS